MESYQDQVLAFLKGELDPEEKQAFEDTLARSTALRAELERSRALLEMMESANERATARRVDEQIRQSIDRGASDIHVIPGLQETIVHQRVDGVLHELERIPRELSQAVVDRWKVLADCDLSVRQLPQEGRILVTQAERDYDLRVTFVPTVMGERVTARILAKSGWTLTLDQLHLTDSQLVLVRAMIRQPNGLIVTAGPDGSGKTATLYGMLLDIQAEQQGRANLMTVEEPAEFVLDGISQIPVNRRIGLTYPVALRAVLKSDLDVVMIGDLPDAETAELAIHLAATGHLVMAPITANHTLHALRRLRERGVDPIMLAQTLIGITSQRLVRRICTNCVTEYEPSSLALQRAGLTRADAPFRRGAGCEACRMTGFKGRTALYEILPIDTHLKTLIAEEASPERLWQETFEKSGGTLWDTARDKVRQGLTTVEEAMRVLFDYAPPGSRAQPERGAAAAPSA